MDTILDDPALIQGVIYVIEHISSGKQYVGQTVSHRKNHARYRPFGANGRFRDHISEAINNTKRKQCTYLNNAIRNYGADAFRVVELLICDREELDENEMYYISLLQSMFPNGYNLTPGSRYVLHKNPVHNNTLLSFPKKHGGCSFRSAETRKLMSQRVQERGFTEEECQARMKSAQQQHYKQKLDRFMHVTLDPAHLDQYIQKRKRGYMVKIGTIEAYFVGKYESDEVLQKRAFEFLKSVTATLPNCSGNP
jgi:hypothetical protein